MTDRQSLIVACASGALWLITMAVFFMVFFDKNSCNRAIKQEKYDELEFVVVHRPHVTYFVDLKYMLCFATRKPDYQDLVAFSCPERLLKEVEGSLQIEATKGVRQ